MSLIFIAYVAVTILCLVVGLVLAWKARRLALPFGGVAALLLAIAGFGLWPWMFMDPASTVTIEVSPAPDLNDVSQASLESYRPSEVPSDGYVAASACAECHKENHSSWHASYHRTMTQIATPEAVFGDFDDKTVSFDGRDYHLTRRGDTFWATLTGKKFAAQNQETSQLPIVMTTGSHHMQVYWFPTGASRILGQLPIVYLKETQQWVPRNACFLEPPGGSDDLEMGRWNNTCSQCHSTHPKLRNLGQYSWDTSVSEFGISCEACHGPGKSHIDFHRGENRDFGLSDPIVNPERLDHRLSSQVCGHCHSITTHLTTETLNHGDTFRPGMTLDTSRHLYRRDDDTIAHLISRGEADPEGHLDSLFWADGMVRVSGREFNGLLESACYQKGEMSCISCHAMHQQADDPRDAKTWANDQLAVGMHSDAACTQCHDATEYDQNHTHHRSESSGSRCYNCHMPHTTYGLLKAIRSHTISSPDLNQDLAGERPGACNLCHLDKSLGWTADHLSRWYGFTRPSLTQDQQTYAAGTLWSLQGDAGTRALVAWHLGWDAAMEASGDQWMPPFLIHLLGDPYDVVRYIASRSLKNIAGFDDLPFNFVAPLEERTVDQTSAFSRWQSRDPVKRDDSSSLLIDDDGRLMRKEFSRLSRGRDDKPMILNE